LKTQVEATKTALNLVNEQISAIPAELVDIRNVREQQKSKSRMLVSLATMIAEQTSLVRLKEIKIDTLTQIMNTTNLEDLLQDKSKIDKLTQNIGSIERNIKEADKKIRMLEDHKYDPNCRFCSENKFVKDAYEAVKFKKDKTSTLEVARTELKVLKPQYVQNSIVRLESIASELSLVERELAGLKLNREKNKNSVTKTELELREITDLIKQYNENKDAIENLEELMNTRVKLDSEVAALLIDLESCESDTLEVVKLIGSCEQKIETLKEQKDEHIDLQNSYAAYDLFMQAMHPNGIAYDVIKKKIPVINEEIAKVLANIVDFEIFFESSGNKFDIFIKHPLYDERPIEMASGAEKTMAAMAIRLALLSVSSLPKGDLFILDEPGTALDEENMEGFIRILELIKVYFKNVLLISHLDSLKDCVDMQIVIEKKDGYARVNQ
jgi:exonuclease SbcC